MLDTKIFNDFIKEIERAYARFRVWVYANNEFVKCQNIFNDVPDGEHCKFTNFWDVTLNSLQSAWILSVSRLLIDDAYHSRDVGQKKPRLSVKYIFNQLDDEDIKIGYYKKTSSSEYKEFMDSLDEIRGGRFAHRNVKEVPNTLKAGVEDCFNALLWLVQEAKSRNKELQSCKVLHYESIDNLSRMGVEELFRKISS